MCIRLIIIWVYPKFGVLDNPHSYFDTPASKFQHIHDLFDTPEVAAGPLERSQPLKKSDELKEPTQKGSPFGGVRLEKIFSQQKHLSHEKNLLTFH